jgi:RNA polymerase sigma-70 factor (ECF subfamily)
MEAASDPFERYRRWLTALARTDFDRRLAEKLDPSDIVQQTLLEAHRDRLAEIVPGEPERMAWLRQALTRNLIDAARRFRSNKRDLALERALDESVSRGQAGLAVMLVAADTSPSLRVARAEEHLRLADALETLPEPQRRAIVLQKWHGRTIRAIAEELGRSEEAVAGLIHRGLKALRAALAEPERGRG